MALIKTLDEIKKMKEGGKLLSCALESAANAVKPGITIDELDVIAEKVIVDGGGRPSFKNYCASFADVPFPSTLCTSINEEVVHGPANRGIILNEGDIIGLDIGCWYKDLATDMAMTVAVGKISPDKQKLINVTRQALEVAIKAAQPGKKISDIGRAVEEVVNPHGFGIVRALVGHGVGHEIHEDPHIPNYYNSHYDKIEIQPGMCLALEPMITLGDYDIETQDDDWTISSIDGSPAAHFEVTIAINDQGNQILTPQPKIK